MSNSWAVVTGASSGLGVAYARRLARDGINVVLVARRADKLAVVAEELQRLGVQTKVVPADLTLREARARVVDACRDLDVSYLINNAGIGVIGEFLDTDAREVSNQVELNITALTELTHAIVPCMVRRGSGAVVNVASTAAFQPMPTFSVYAASKSYVVRFTVALWEELRRTGVRAIAICPGPTDTEFFANAGDDSVMSQRRTPEQVVDTTWAGLKAHRPLIVDGTVNKGLAFVTRFAPVELQAIIARQYATH
ncbi:MAG TPA: SDR family oxidoreductase [Tessaracoccus flavescens]|uniref:SDR family oxidoreductase n=1 Tax=Tessaracoccus flavescens TaxID=399497 RepID=A0A921EL30_9ACTN|nr:SDR family oxidoreductase [Tessaracoccus flavescens]